MIHLYRDTAEFGTSFHTVLCHDTTGSQLLKAVLLMAATDLSEQYLTAISGLTHGEP